MAAKAYSGDSIAAFDANQSTEIRLTKFNSLKTREDPQSPSASSSNSLNPARSLTNIDTNLKSISTTDLLNSEQQQPKFKWPWLNSANQREANNIMVASSNSNHNLSIQHHQVDEVDEPFRVVWRRLSFEVKQNSYTKFAGRTLEKLQSFTGFGGDSTNEANKTSQPDDVRTPVNSKYRTIFDDLNGCIKSGEISAILGPSGAGKTSLLNAICGKVDNYRGSVQLIGGGQRKMRLSIIPQKDYLMETLTVRENLLYSSKLLNSSCGFDHNANILRVVQMLNLLNCLDSRAAKISGGEYKRVSIAQELLRQPDILILDEPTSGLDSMNCKNLIRSLVQLIEASRRGAIKQIAIVLTIHQPDVDVFHMFDHVYCMAKRGRVIYDGHPNEVMKVLANQSMGSLDLEQSTSNLAHVNPANLLIEVASDVYGEQVVDRLAKLQRQQFALSEYEGDQGNPTSPEEQLKNGRQLSDESVDQDEQKVQHSKGRPPALSTNQSTDSQNQLGDAQRPGQLIRDKRLAAKNENQGNFWYHTKLLTSRAFISTVRDPLLALVVLIFHLTIPFVMWMIYSSSIGTVKSCPLVLRDFEVLSLVRNKTMDIMEDLQEQLSRSYECGNMFFLTTYAFSMCSTSMAALAFPLSMHILLKEVRNGWYSLPSFVIAKTFASFPFEVLFPVVSIAMVYVLLGMPSSYMEWRLGGIALAVALVSMISNTQGLIFGALCMNSVQTAIFFASVATMPQVFLSGYTARINQLPWLIKKLSWLSYLHYSTDIINMMRFGFGTCPCDSSTDEYLRTEKPYFSDIPSNIKPFFNLYLTDNANEQAAETTTILPNDTLTLANASLIQSTVANTTRGLVPGISQALAMNSSDRADIISMIDSKEIDVFDRLAYLVARSFSFGRAIEGCDSVKSQLLITYDSPREDYLPLLFGGLVGIFVVTKLILILIVKYKIGSRI